MKTIIVVFHPHPEQSKRNKLLVSAVKNLKNVTIHYVDKKYMTATKQDIEKERELLRQNQQVVFQFPVYWYMLPAVGKKYIDEIFEDGFGYKIVHGNYQFSEMEGKTLKVVATAGESISAYRHTDDIFGVYKRIADGIGMKYGGDLLFCIDDGDKKISEYVSLVQ